VDNALEERIDAGRKAVLAQADFLHAHLGEVASEWKHDASRVTAVDLAIAEEIFADLGKRFLEDDFFSEEMDPGQGTLIRRSRFSWILDPVDGTNNYAIGLPFCSIALALLHDGRPAYGFVYDAARRRLIEGGAGRGLRDGDRYLPPGSIVTALSEFVGMHSPRRAMEKHYMQALVESFKVRALGSSALHLAYVANGILAGMVDVNVKIWDIAAAYALCEAVNIKVQIVNTTVFPLERFDLHMPPLHVCAGESGLCDRLAAILSKSG